MKPSAPWSKVVFFHHFEAHLLEVVLEFFTLVRTGLWEITGCVINLRPVAELLRGHIHGCMHAIRLTSQINVYTQYALLCKLAPPICMHPRSGRWVAAEELAAPPPTDRDLGLTFALLAATMYRPTCSECICWLSAQLLQCISNSSCVLMYLSLQGLHRFS